jgi:hypothetical protein
MQNCSFILILPCVKIGIFRLRLVEKNIIEDNKMERRITKN